VLLLDFVPLVLRLWFNFSRESALFAWLLEELFAIPNVVVVLVFVLRSIVVVPVLDYDIVDMDSLSCFCPSFPLSPESGAEGWAR
jgi:hypothetical protein